MRYTEYKSIDESSVIMGGNILKQIYKSFKLNKTVWLVFKALKLEAIYKKYYSLRYMRYDENLVLKDINSYKYKPLISIITPVHNVSPELLRQCVDSVLAQSYPKWELCIVDDCSTNCNTKKVLRSLEKKSSKIKLTINKTNCHISESSNRAIEMATGEYILLLDNDDLLHRHCLYEVVKVFNNKARFDLVFSDEDKIKDDSFIYPYFKPGWDRKLLEIENYICHVGVYRKEIVSNIGGFRKAYDGAQDWDMVLRFTMQTDKVYHIPKILYHWRMTHNSTSKSISNKPYAVVARQKVREALREGKYAK